MNIPFFKYNPNPINLETAKSEKITCQVCNKESELSYNGSLYCVETTGSICLNCVADGSAAKKFNGEYQSDYEEIDNPEAIDELLHRTPSYSSWQGHYWLAHCNDFCAILDYVKWDDIQHLEEELMEDLKRLSEDYGANVEEFKDYLNGGIDGYLFKCIHCGKHRLHADCS